MLLAILCRSTVFLPSGQSVVMKTVGLCEDTSSLSLLGNWWLGKTRGCWWLVDPFRLYFIEGGVVPTFASLALFWMIDSCTLCHPCADI